MPKTTVTEVATEDGNMVDKDSTQADQPSTTTAGLACLKGAPPPPDMGRDLLALLKLPDRAREEFWLPLRAYLRPELDDEAERAISSYCDKHDLAPADLAPAIKATRHLFREGARAAVGKEDFVADVHALVPEDDARALLALLLPWFEDFFPKLRGELIRRAITDHGKLVVDSRWRVERITSSDRGVAIDATVAVMTFNYVEGGQERRVSLHFLPDQIATLREAADEMLG